MHKFFLYLTILLHFQVKPLSDSEYCGFLSKNYFDNDYWIVVSVVQNGKTEKLITSNYALFLLVYKKMPKKMSYSQFLYQYVVQKKNIPIKSCDCKNFAHLNINKELYSIYKLKGIQFITKNYTHQVDGLTKLNTNKLKNKDTILLIMSENKYLITQDDYSGEYLFFNSIPK